MADYIKPTWPAPTNVFAYTTKRTGGVSKTPYDTFNFSLSSGDRAQDVITNRERLKHELTLPQEPTWLQQEHTSAAIEITPKTKFLSPPTADASFTRVPGFVCTVLTADCVPILVCDKGGTVVGVIHAGWKGILAGVIDSVLGAINVESNQILAWLGPAIGPRAFKVQQDFYAAFCHKLPASKQCFTQREEDLYADIYALATLFLQQAGVTHIYGGEYCTFTQQELFFSYRRDGKHSGRMASVIWLAH